MDNQVFLMLSTICFGTAFCLLGGKATNLQQLACMANRYTVTVIVYDESYDHSKPVLSLMENCSQLSLLYEYRQFYAILGHQMETLMKGLPNTQYRVHFHFMLICRRICIENVMRHATFLDNTIGLRSLLRHFSTWLVISHDSPPNQNIILDNVAFVRLSVSYKKKETPTSCTILKEVQTSTDQNVQAIAVSTLSWMPRGREWSRVQIRGVTHEKTLYSAIFPNTKRGLNGRQLLLATLEWRPYTARHVKNGEVYYTGAGIDVMDILAKKFNFSFAILEPEDMLWGRELENGSWNGVTGMIHRGEVDSCPVPLGISLGRKKVMDFTSPVVATEYRAFYRRRTDYTKPWLHFLSCFSWPVFLCGAVSLLWIVCLLIYVQRKVNVTSGHVPMQENAQVSKCVEIGIRVSLRQDLLTQPATTSIKFVIGTLSALCLVISAIYTGNFVAFATVNIYKPPFNTLQDLALQNDYEVGTFEGGYAENVFMTTDDPLLKSLYKKVRQSTSTTNCTGNLVSDTIQRVLDQKYVLISTLAVKNIIKSVTCDVVEIQEKLFPFHSSFIFPRHSPLIQLFDAQIQMISESGMMEKLIQYWTPKPKMCEPSMEPISFKLDSLKTVLVTCSAGTLVAVVILFVEMGKRRR